MNPGQTDACLEQVNNYTRDFGSRYCYLVSPFEVVVARRTVDQVGKRQGMIVSLLT